MNTHDAWETIHRNQNWGSYPSEHIIRFVARNYYNRERGKTKILDFGCGTGAHTWYLAREGFDTYAFDISETAVRKLQDRMDREGLPVHACVMDGLHLSYPEDFFDAVIDNVSIQSNRLLDIKTMYQKVYDILKGEGRFLTTVFSRNTTGYGTGTMIEPGTYEGLRTGNLQGLGCRHFFESAELESILEQIGFSDINIDTLRYTDRGSVVEELIAMAVK